MKKITCFTAFILIALLCFGQIPQPLPNTYVNDYAKVLEPKQIVALNDTLRAIESRTSVQIAIVLVKELPSTSTSVEDYTMNIGRTWHVGNAHNGIVYVAVLEPHLQALQPAQQVQGELPDIRCKEILSDIKPYFRDKDWYGGLNNMLENLKQNIDPVAKEQLRLAQIAFHKRLLLIGSVALRIGYCIACLGLCYLAVLFLYIRPRKAKKREKEQAAEIATRERESLYSNNLSGQQRPHLNVVQSPPLAVYNNIYERKVKQPKVEVELPSSSAYMPVVSSMEEEESNAHNYRDDDHYESHNNDNDGDWGGSSIPDSTSGFDGGGASDNW